MRGNTIFTLVVIFLGFVGKEKCYAADDFDEATQETGMENEPATFMTISNDILPDPSEATWVEEVELVEVDVGGNVVRVSRMLLVEFRARIEFEELLRAINMWIVLIVMFYCISLILMDMHVSMMMGFIDANHNPQIQSIEVLFIILVMIMTGLSIVARNM